MPRKIVTTGTDRQENHRTDFKTCPACERQFDHRVWDKHAQILVLSPTIFRASSVAVMSPCPVCAELSWVHHRMGSFALVHPDWPKAWQTAVDKKEAQVKLTALRDWGAGLCWQCKHLQSGVVDHTARRVCIVGIGAPRTACARFEALTRKT